MNFDFPALPAVDWINIEARLGRAKQNMLTQAMKLRWREKKSPERMATIQWREPCTAAERAGFFIPGFEHDLFEHRHKELQDVVARVRRPDAWQVASEAIPLGHAEAGIKYIFRIDQESTYSPLSSLLTPQTSSSLPWTLCCFPQAPLLLLRPSPPDSAQQPG